MKRRGKSPNGKGRTKGFNVRFDPSIREQHKAHEMSQRLADRQHGGRKALIVAFLNAIYEYESITGKHFSTDMVASLVFQSVMTGGSAQPLLQTVHHIEHPGRQELSIKTTSVEKATSDDVAMNFLKGRSNR